MIQLFIIFEAYLFKIMSDHLLLSLFVITISLMFRGSNGSPLDEKCFNSRLHRHLQCFNETQEEFSLAKNMDSSHAVVVVDIKYGQLYYFRILWNKIDHFRGIPESI